MGVGFHKKLRSIRKQMGVGFHKKLRALRLIKKPRHIQLMRTFNLLPELFDDPSGRCDVLEKEVSVMCVDDTEEFMWKDHRQAPCEVLGPRCL